jgi:hypothetical protein
LQDCLPKEQEIIRIRPLVEDTALGHQSEADLGHISSRLRDRVWSPLAPALEGVTHAYVAPDGDLSLIPFEVLAEETANGITWPKICESFIFHVDLDSRPATVVLVWRERYDQCVVGYSLFEISSACLDLAFPS